jgi:hypothetical protein
MKTSTLSARPLGTKALVRGESMPNSRISFPSFRRLRFTLPIALALTAFGSPFNFAQQKEQSVEEPEKKDAARRRIEWFYNQRAFPFGQIPPDARAKALRELDEILVREGKLVRRADGSVAAPAEAAALAAGTTWTSIGPQPTLARGPGVGAVSGRVTALAVDPTNANIVYLGGAQGGIWKTVDGGNSWMPLTDGQPSLAIGSIALDPNSCSPTTGCQTIYVGTGEENFSVDSYYGAGVLKSTNGGNTWTQLGASTFFGPFNSGFSPGGGARIGALAVSRTNPSVILAGVQIFVRTNNGATSGIYRSADGGTTWTRVLSGAAGTEVVFDPNGTTAYAALGTIFGVAANGVYKSTDTGQTWQKLTITGADQTRFGRIEIALAPSSPSTIYASIADSTQVSNTLLGMFKSTDGGNAWTQLTNTPDFCHDQCWYDHVVRVSPVDPNTLFAGGSAVSTGFLIRSTDGGISWIGVTIGGGVTLHVDQHALGFSSDGTRLYVGNDGGAYRTDSPASISWMNLNTTLDLAQFYPGLSIHPSNQQIGFGGTQDNGTQKFTGPSLLWTEVTCGDGGFTTISPAIPSTTYAACADIDVRKSFQNGDNGTFVESDSGIDPADRSAFIPPLVIDPSTPERLYFGTFRVYQSVNGAGSWTAVSNDLTGGDTNANVFAIAVDPTNSNVVYAGTDNGHVAVCQNAGAASASCWQDVSTGLPSRVVTQIAVDASDASGKTAYVAFSGFSSCSSGCDGMGHILKTINAGATWVPINGNLPDTPVNDIVIDPDDATHNTLFVATDIGVFQTIDGGMTWSPLAPASPGVLGLPRVAVLSLKLRETSRTLRAATHGRGMWDFQLAGVPVFSLTSISPTSVSAGSGPFTLTLNGNGFTSNSTVQWKAGSTTTPIMPTFVNANQLTATISGTLVSSAGTAQVSVSDPSSGSTSALVFAITGSLPVLFTVTPNTAPAGSGATNITLAGSNFASNAQVFWNDSPSGVTTTFVNSGQLNAVISSTLLTFGGINIVTVINPPPGGGPSNGVTFTVTAPAPTNDQFPGTTVTLSASNTFSDTVDSSGATTNTGGIADPTPPPSCFTDTTGLVNNGRAKSIWYRFAPSSTLSITADTIGSSYDTILSVWTGSAGNLTQPPVACNDDIIPGIVRQSRVTFTANAGTTYFFMITAFSGDGGKSVFNIAASGGGGGLVASPSSTTINAGQSASFTITVGTGSPAFSSPVTLAVTSGCPPASTCSLALTSVNVGSSTQLNVSTTARGMVPAMRPLRPQIRRGPEALPFAWLVLLLLALSAATVAARTTKRPKLSIYVPLGGLILFVILHIAGCGGGGGGGGGGGTPAGTYTITVTGTSGSTQHSATVTLIVN